MIYLALILGSPKIIFLELRCSTFWVDPVSPSNSPRSEPKYNLVFQFRNPFNSQRLVRYKSWPEEKTPVLLQFHRITTQHEDADFGPLESCLYIDAHHLVLYHHIPLYAPQEAPFSSFSSWSQGSTYCRKCARYALQEPMADVLAVG